jgi:hypothetical protein
MVVTDYLVAAFVHGWSSRGALNSSHLRVAGLLLFKVRALTDLGVTCELARPEDAVPQTSFTNIVTVCGGIRGDATVLASSVMPLFILLVIITTVAYANIKDNPVGHMDHLLWKLHASSTHVYHPICSTQLCINGTNHRCFGLQRPWMPRVSCLTSSLEHTAERLRCI